MPAYPKRTAKPRESGERRLSCDRMPTRRSGCWNAWKESISRSRLGQLPIPALVIHGSRDAIAPLASSQKLAASLQRATLAVIDGAGHVPTVTRPDWLTNKIEEFFGAGGAKLRQE
ncbi:alpha/beta fold hydrolase [Bradyrhizobium sp. RDT10]